MFSTARKNNSWIKRCSFLKLKILAMYQSTLIVFIKGQLSGWLQNQSTSGSSLRQVMSGCSVNWVVFNLNLSQTVFIDRFRINRRRMHVGNTVARREAFPRIKKYRSHSFDWKQAATWKTAKLSRRNVFDNDAMLGIWSVVKAYVHPT